MCGKPQTGIAPANASPTQQHPSSGTKTLNSIATRAFIKSDRAVFFIEISTPTHRHHARMNKATQPPTLHVTLRPKEPLALRLVRRPAASAATPSGV